MSIPVFFIYFIDELDASACAFNDTKHSDRKTGLLFVYVSEKKCILSIMTQGRF